VFVLKGYNMLMVMVPAVEFTVNEFSVGLYAVLKLTEQPVEAMSHSADTPLTDTCTYEFEL
jgi:hypothetical protein